MLQDISTGAVVTRYSQPAEPTNKTKSGERRSWSIFLITTRYNKLKHQTHHKENSKSRQERSTNTTRELLRTQQEFQEQLVRKSQRANPRPHEESGQYTQASDTQ